jgi:hypothetical protein
MFRDSTQRAGTRAHSRLGRLPGVLEKRVPRTTSVTEKLFLPGR